MDGWRTRSGKGSYEANGVRCGLLVYGQLRRGRRGVFRSIYGSSGRFRNSPTADAAAWHRPNSRRRRLISGRLSAASQNDSSELMELRPLMGRFHSSMGTAVLGDQLVVQKAHARCLCGCKWTPAHPAATFIAGPFLWTILGVSTGSFQIRNTTFSPPKMRVF